MKTALLFLSVLLIACSPSENKDVTKFIVSEVYKPFTQPREHSDSIKPPPPPPPFYLKHQFLIDTAGQIYYYQMDHSGKWQCASGYDSKIPEYINLQPINLIQLPEQAIKDFVRMNILTEEPEERAVTIASLEDTLTAPAFFALKEALWDSSYKVRLHIRLATQEEAIVLSYRQKHDYYIPERVHWDTSKIRFPPVLSEE